MYGIKEEGPDRQAVVSTQRFVVLGRTCGRMTSETNRKFHDSFEAAEAHASDLIEHQRDGKAYIAEIRAVVEVKRPIVTRSPRPTDFE